VGQAVIALAKLRGLNTINLIRKKCVLQPLFQQAVPNSSIDRENFSDVQKYLESLGATRVITYDDLEDRSISDRVKEWTGGKVRAGLLLRFRSLMG
jgi:trans-2-enoyl-CoA reductase